MCGIEWRSSVSPESFVLSIRFAAIVMPRVQSLWVLLAFVGASCVPSVARADVLMLSSSRDNSIFQVASPSSQQTSNALGNLFAGRNNMASNNLRRGLIAFDLSSLPAGATITEVKLTLFDASSANGTRTVRLHRTLEDWGQGTSSGMGQGGNATANDATWHFAKYNAIPGLATQWTTPGGVFSSTASAATTVGANGIGQAYEWSSSQMVSDVQLWAQNPNANFGWTLLGDETASQTAKQFFSSEAAQAPLRPTLQITFTAVPEPSSLLCVGLLSAAAWGRRRVLRPRGSAQTASL